MLHPVVSVVVPARNEATTIAGVVAGALALGHDQVAEVVVVDDGSIDGTPEVAEAAGARVVRGDGPFGAHGRGPGKGQAMWRGLAEAIGDLVVFCDGDLDPFDADYIPALASVLVRTPEAALVKGRYRRAGTGGRVNELVARPSIDLLHPALGRLAQPLGGEYAAWRDVLERVPFVHGYGVDLGLAIDIASRFGPSSVIEVDLSPRSHRNRSLEELRPQATAVLEVALARAGVRLPRPAECPPLGEVPGYVRRSA